MFTQLTLDLQLKDCFTFDNFVTGENQALVDLLKTKSNEKQIYIWGAHNTGKSHLIQSLCQLHFKDKKILSYLPMKQLIDYSPDVFEGQETMDVCCIDDVHLLQNKADWQEALFNLINRIRENKCQLIISANQPPTDINIQLNDLISRLQWGPVFKLNELNYDDKCRALQLRAQGRGFDLAENVAKFLLNNFHRDIADLFELLNTLDKAQLEQHRRLTIPFVKSVLSR